MEPVNIDFTNDDLDALIDAATPITPDHDPKVVPLLNYGSALWHKTLSSQLDPTT